MGERLGRTPTEGIPRQLDDEALRTINEKFGEGGEDATSEQERYSEEIDLLCHRIKDMKRLRDTIDSDKDDAMTYLDQLSLPDETRRENDLIELSRRAGRIVDDALTMLASEHTIVNPELLESPGDAKTALTHLRADMLRNINDDLLSRYKDLQDLHVEVARSVEQYRDRLKKAV